MSIKQNAEVEGPQDYTLGALATRKQNSGMQITQMSLDIKPDHRLSLKQSLATIKYKELQSNATSALDNSVVKHELPRL